MIQCKANGKINFVMWHQNLEQGLGTGPSQQNFWNKSIITTEHFTITVSVITGKMDFLAELKKFIQTDFLPHIFPKEMRKREVL